MKITKRSNIVNNTHGQYGCTLGNVKVSVHIVGSDTMREDERGDRQPSHSLDDYSLDVNKLLIVSKVREPLSSNDTMEFSVCFLLDVRIQRHCNEKALYCIRCLRECPFERLVHMEYEM